MNFIFKKRKKLLYPPEKEFKKILKNIIGFFPSNLKLYQLAFTHKSISVHKFNDIKINNERLEYLGDAILDAIIADFLYQNFPDEDEGFLTQMRSKIVNRDFLNTIAIKLGIPFLLKANIKNDHKKYIYGDALEALVGALYLEKGFEKTKKIIVEKILKNHVNIEKLKYLESDFKSKILEWGQKNKKNVIFTCYEDHKEGNSNVYVSNLYIMDEIYGRGMGFSKKEAEQNAAKQALEKLGEI